MINYFYKKLSKQLKEKGILSVDVNQPVWSVFLTVRIK